MLNALLWNLMLTTTLALVLAFAGRLPWMKRRPALRHWLWLLLLAKLVTPPLISLPLLPAHPADTDLTAAFPLSDGPGVAVARGDVPVGSYETDWYDSSVAVGEADVTRDQGPWTLADGTSASILGWLIGVSMLGSLLLVTFYGFHAAKLSRWLKRAGREDTELARSCSDVALQLGVRSLVRSYVVDARMPPLLWGWRRPMVVMPRQLMDDLDQPQRDSIIAHELAHYLRRDHWANAAAFLVKILMWWDPVVWWAHREVRAAQELCCDALTIERCNGSRRSYATTLLQALDFVQVPPFAQRALALGIGSSSALVRRFEMIGDKRLSCRMSRWTLLLLLTAVVPLLCFPVRGQEQVTSGDSKNSSSEANAITDSADAPARPGKKELAIDSGEHLFLTGTVAQRGASETRKTAKAWLYDRKKRTEVTVVCGAVIRVGEQSVIVEDIKKNSVVISVDDGRRVWKLGLSFSAMLKEEPAGGGDDSPTDLALPVKTQSDDASRLKVEIELLNDLGVAVFRGKSEDVKQAIEILRQIEKSGLEEASDDDTDPPHLVAYRITGQDPELVLQVLRTLLAEMPNVKLDIDRKSNNLIVLAEKRTHQTIEEFLKQIRSFAAESSTDNGLPDGKPKRVDGPMLRFNFRFQPWADVLEWYAKAAGLSLVMEKPIPGTLNYWDEEAHSVTASLDILNSVLLTKGFVLLRCDRVLMVVDVEEGIPPSAVPRVPVAELKQRGKFEIVSVMFPLGGRDGEKVKSEISPLLSPCGSVVSLPQTRQMLITDRAGIMRTIAAVIEAIPD